MYRQNSMFATLASIIILLLSSTDAQFLPLREDDPDITTIQSPVDGNITISFKSPPVGTCTTVFSTQKQYTGYVTLPPNALIPTQGDYPINTFFWFIEARQVPENAPLTIFINGGPGSSSMVGLFQENEPCEVVEIAKDQLGTQARPWGWDRSSNILYVDQPVQVGFSYDTSTNASLNLLTGLSENPPGQVPPTQPPYTFLNGTFSSGNPVFSANTSDLAAQSIWHFLQGFLGTFPQYNPGLRPNSSTRNGVVGVNLFTESYGGKYAPVMASFFEAQNALRLTSPYTFNGTLEIHLVSVGIINGFVDMLVQAPLYPRFAYNNTYGIQALTLLQQVTAANSFLSADGCQQLILSCRALQITADPLGTGNVDMVNSKCNEAQAACFNDVIGPYSLSGRSVYDISQNTLDPFPDNFYLEYLNSRDVQQGIGAPVNYTQNSAAVFSAFTDTGDYSRDGQIADLASLLSQGIRVALIYGDRDYIANWVGGEAISFSVAGAAQPQYAPWYSAGYAPIVTNSTYIGGAVRQYGNLSFSRVYDAGHLVPAYQPETAFTIFTRIIQGDRIDTGEAADLSTFSTVGGTNSTTGNVAPAMRNPVCNLRAVDTTCNPDQQNQLANKAGVIINGVLYQSEADWVPPPGSVSAGAGKPGVPPSSMIVSAPPPSTGTATSSSGKGGSSASTTSGLPTGVYIATAIPSTSSRKTGGVGSAKATAGFVKLVLLVGLAAGGVGVS